jgi:ribosomal-protein-alanine N-acetyltransferase
MRQATQRGDGVVKSSGMRVTARLRLVPIGSEHANDLFRLHQDPGIARWYAGVWTPDQARQSAASIGHAWQADGVHKWIAYGQVDGELIGRGGLSYTEVDGARRLEIGWAIRERFWGQGYASEIGRAGLALAFGELDAPEVVSFTETYNTRSRAVMERLGFHYEHEIRHHGEPFALYALRHPQIEDRL